MLQKEIQIAKQKYRDSIKAKYFCCYKADLFLVKEILKKRGMYE